jgi:hypothetical protein
MKIRYRDAHGRMISGARARTRKRVVSEIYDEKTGKRIGSPVSGYYKEIKKLARDAMPKVTTRTMKTYTPRTTPKPIRTYYMDEPDYEGEPDDETMDELEEQWTDLYEDDFAELDEYFDDLESLLDDDNEWYTNE